MVEPQGSGTALLLIDLINDLDFPGSEAMRAKMEAMLAPIERFIAEAHAADVPIVYVNDNFDQWHSDRERIVEHCLREESAGRAFVERLRPGPEDYFVIKPQFSGFYATNLPVLLPRLGVSRLILAGVAADICVLFTAGGAHMRAYDLWVPCDLVASGEDDHRDWALGIMARSMKAETASTAELRLADWLARGA